MAPGKWGGGDFYLKAFPVTICQEGMLYDVYPVSNSLPQLSFRLMKCAKILVWT